MALLCPDIPAQLRDGIPAPGSAAWCAWIDDTVAFLAQLSTTVRRWIIENLDYHNWWNAVNHYRNDLISQYNDKASGSAFSNLLGAWIDVVGWILQLLKEIMSGLDIGVELLSCIWDVRKVLLPEGRAEAYTGAMIVRNVVRSIGSIKVGSQSYLGITANILVEIQAVDEVISHILDYLLPLNMPSVSEATAAWAHGIIGAQTRDCVWKWWGHNPDGYEAYVVAGTPAISPQQAIELARRLQLDEADTSKILIRSGVIDGQQRQRMEILYDRLPSQGEALEWTRRLSANEAFVAKYKLDAGFDDQYWPAYQEALTSVGVTRDVARYNYIQHWTPLGRGELDQLYYRLRPNNPDSTIVFDAPDYKAYLSALGYAPVAQEWLYQLRYRPLSIGDATDLYRRGLAAPSVVQNSYLDAGQSPEHALVLAQREQYSAARWRAGEFAGWTPAGAGKAFAIGLLSQSQVAQILAPLGGGPADVTALTQRASADYQYRILQRAIARVLTTAITSVRQSLRVGVLDVQGATTALAAVGWPAAQATGIATLESANARTALVKQAVGHMRTALLAGEITVAYAESALTKLGVVPSAIAQYIALWNIQNTPQRKRRSASQIVNDLAEGTLAIVDATARLGNLGYNADDISLYLLDAQRKQISSAPARAEAAAQRAGMQVASKTYMPGLSKRAVAELRAQETPTMLATYLKGGIVSEQYVVMRLQLYGWEAQPIADFVAKNGGTTSGSNTVSGAPAQTAGVNGEAGGGGAG
jgi:hypothetical protein